MPEPLYRQIAEALRARIESGELGHGAQLPTEMELRDQFDASRNTVRDAIKLLATRGLVETRLGHGTFVVDKVDPFVTTLDVRMGFGDEDNVRYVSEVAARMRRSEVSVPRVEIHQASADVAAELRLERGALVVSRTQRRFIDGTPWSLQETFYPMRYVDAGARALIEAQDMPHGAVRYLEESLGIKQAGWRDKITVRAPDAEEARFFHLPDDGRVAVFEIRRIAYERGGLPLRVTLTIYPADRNQFVMTVGDVPPDG
jgi:GntR family transcriptional regulator